MVKYDHILLSFLILPSNSMGLAQDNGSTNLDGSPNVTESAPPKQNEEQTTQSSAMEAQQNNEKSNLEQQEKNDEQSSQENKPETNNSSTRQGKKQAAPKKQSTPSVDAGLPSPGEWMLSIADSKWFQTPGIISNIHIQIDSSATQEYRELITLLPKVSSNSYLNFIDQKHIDFETRLNQDNIEANNKPDHGSSDNLEDEKTIDQSTEASTNLKKSVDQAGKVEQQKKGDAPSTPDQESKEDRFALVENFNPFMGSIPIDLSITIKKNSADVLGHPSKFIDTPLSWTLSPEDLKTQEAFLNWIRSHLLFDAVVIDAKPPYLLIASLKPIKDFANGVVYLSENNTVSFNKYGLRALLLAVPQKSDGYLHIIKVIAVKGQVNDSLIGSRLLFNQ